MSRLLAVAVVVLATAAAALAAVRLSEPAYIRAATKICTQRTRAADAFPRLPKSASTHRVTVRLEKVVPIYRRALKRFQALRMPHSLKYLAPRWLHEEGKRVQALNQALAAGRKGNRNTMFAFIDRSTLYAASADQQANNIGISGCT